MGIMRVIHVHRIPIVKLREILYATLLLIKEMIVVVPTLVLAVGFGIIVDIII